MLTSNEFPALLLNADFRPMQVAPLSTLSWQTAVSDVLQDKLVVVAEYDRVIRSPTFEMRLPSVVATRRHVNMSRPANRTRWNMFLAYDFTCCFCGVQFPTEELTFEHLLPRCRGGRTSWDNIQPACVPCNTKKGARTPKEAGMPLIRQPYHPTRAQLNEIGKKYAPVRAGMHKTWADFLYWTTPLEP